LIDRRSLILACAAAVAGRPRSARAAPARLVPLRLTTFNVHVQNTDYGRFSRFVQETSPDVVLLQEADRRWLTSTALDSYPFDRSGPGRLVMASRLPLIGDSAAEAPALSRRGSMQRARLELDGAADPVLLYNVHPGSPRTARGAARQALDYADFARVLSADPEHATIIAAGDFNALPDSELFRTFREKAGLTLLEGDSVNEPTRFARELGLGPWLGLPIDHVVARGPVELTRRMVGPDLGSDHLPVTVDLMLALPPD
jgi:endonuclease/exonuclease/phosphatase (EEP) superfamily protein YafD